MSKKLLCQYCGEGHAFANLRSHIDQCSKNWVLTQRQLIPELQRVFPPREIPGIMFPSSESDSALIEKYNQLAKNLYIQESLNPCPGCRCLFTAQDLGSHFLDCDKDSKDIQPPVCPSPRRPPSSASSSRGKTPIVVQELKKQSPVRSSTTQPTMRESQQEFKQPKNSPQDFYQSIDNNASINNFLPSRGNSAQGSRNSQQKRKAPVRDINGKPLAYCCHLCGRDYLTVDSLLFHIPQCLEKRNSLQKELPRDLRTKAPKAPTTVIPEDKFDDNFLAQLDDYNREAYRIYETNSRIPCKYCGRKFNPDSLMVHWRSCEKSAQANASSTLPGGLNKAGLGQQQRGPNATVNPNFMPVGRSHSNPMMGAYEEVERMPCPKCGRQFALDRISKHETTCKGIGIKKDNEPSASKLLAERIKNLPSVNHSNVIALTQSITGSFSKPVEDERVPCSCCGRKFAADRVEKHEKICKGKMN